MDMKTAPARTTWLHMDDDTPCTTPGMCSAMGRDAYLPGGMPDADTLAG
jgi:hypothetical protein